jgi:hypothetical protein
VLKCCSLAAAEVKADGILRTTAVVLECLFEQISNWVTSKGDPYPDSKLAPLRKGHPNFAGDHLECRESTTEKEQASMHGESPGGQLQVN